MLEAQLHFGVIVRMDRLTGSQARAARAMLMWSVRQLAQQCAISESSIRRIEAAFDHPEKVSFETLTKLHDFYVGRGFTFFRDERGAAVAWRRQDRRTGNDRRDGGSGEIETRAAGVVGEMRA